jgi:uncharacterized protein (TIGR02145 family)
MKIILFVILIIGLSSFLNAQTQNGPCPGVPTVSYAGLTYNTVQIGNQCWLKENINVGKMIDSTKDQINNSIIEKYCYNNNPINCTAYGGLYQWGEAVQYKNGTTDTTLATPRLTGNVQGICPIGWHIPSKDDFKTLSDKVKDCNELKAIGQGTGTGTGTDATGFSGLLAGARFLDNEFTLLGENTYFWSSDELSDFSAYGRTLYNNKNNFGFFNTSKKGGYSIRCLKD